MNPGPNSEFWWDDIKRYADLFHRRVLSLGGKESRVELNRNKLEKVRYTYNGNLKALKRKIYGRKACDGRVDRHKIVALYIKSFLEESPFSVKGPGVECKADERNCPNEFFAMELMHLILMAWNETHWEVRHTNNEKEWFIRLLNYYKMDIRRLDVLSLAQIVYYIESKHVK